MKTKLVLLTLILAFSHSFANAQEKKKFDIQAYRLKKAEYLTKALKLTDEEVKTFIPLTEELMSKKYQLNRPIRHKIRELKKKKNVKESEYQSATEQYLNIQIEEAKLEKEYYLKFKPILSAKKIAKYYRAEKEFSKEILGNKRY